MKLEKHISNLLYRYDCVIVPDFGGFLTQKYSSQFNPISYEFFPPKKELRFNSNLKDHDGLLVNYISQVENKSFEEVFTLVQNKVKKWSSKLVEEKKLSLNNIGDFILNEEGNLVFSPFEEINYAKDSFGFAPIKAHYILREEELNKRYFSWKKVSKIVAGLALLASVGTLGYTQKDQVKYQMANMFSPMVFEETRNFSSFVSHNPALYPQPHIMKRVAAENLVKLEISGNIEEPVKEVKEKKVVDKKVGKYQLIGGAFKNANNAKKKLKQLRAQGYKNARILGSLSGMTIVSYDTYHNQQKAQRAANRLKAQGKEIWVRIKK